MQAVKEKEDVTFLSIAGSWVIVQGEHQPDRTRGGIFLTPNGRTELKQELGTGTVLCVGPGNVLPNGAQQPRPCTGGDRVLWSRYGERLIRPGDDDHGDLVAVPFQELIGVLA